MNGLSHSFQGDVLVIRVTTADKDWESLALYRREIILHKEVHLDTSKIYVFADKMVMEISSLYHACHAIGHDFKLIAVNRFAQQVLLSKAPNLPVVVELGDT